MEKSSSPCRGRAGTPGQQVAFDSGVFVPGGTGADDGVASKLSVVAQVFECFSPVGNPSNLIKEPGSWHFAYGTRSLPGEVLQRGNTPYRTSWTVCRQTKIVGGGCIIVYSSVTQSGAVVNPTTYLR